MNKAELKIEMIRHNDNGETLAKALGISRQTLSNKMCASGTVFNQNEISIIKERYNLTGEKLIEIFFN